MNNNTILNINPLPQKNNSINTSQTNNVERCKKVLMDQQMIPMLSIKNIIVGGVGTVIPWVILLFIVCFIIII